MRRRAVRRASAPFALDRVGQVAIRVRDLDRAVAFYRDKLGMKFLFRVPNMAFVQCGDLTLLLGLPEDPGRDHPSSLIYFAVPDIDAAFRTLLERGVEAHGSPHLVHRAPDHELWMAFFQDADDNPLALMGRKPPR